MRPGIVDRVLYSYRIGDPAGKYSIYDDEGARLFPGRWNTTNSPMLYSSEHYATALIEKLAHFNGVLPDNQHYIRITIPPGVSYEEFQPTAHLGWDGIDDSISTVFGAKWHFEHRSCLLIVPSIPGGRIERNFLINLRHPDAGKITHDRASSVAWDTRLFQI